MMAKKLDVSPLLQMIVVDLNRQKDNRPFLHYYDLDKKGYRYATNWEIL